MIEKVKNKLRMQKLRADPNYRKNENLKKKAKIRNNAEVHNKIKLEDCKRKQEKRKTNLNCKKPKKDSEFSDNIKHYEKEIQEGPTYVCCCCGLLLFRKSVVKFETTKYEKFGEKFLKKAKNDFTNSSLVCQTCDLHLKKGKIPTICLDNGLDFFKIPEKVLNLTTLEERLICTRLPFIRIVSLGVDRQKGSIGNIANVPISVVNTVSVLPRQFNNCEIIQLNLVRRMSDNHSYMYETVRPKVVIEALKELINTPLYVDEGVSMCDNWSHQSQDLVDFIVNTDNVDNEYKICSSKTIGNEVNVSEENEPINPGGQETLILDQNEIVDMKIAPGEGDIILNFYKSRLM